MTLAQQQKANLMTRHARLTIHVARSVTDGDGRDSAKQRSQDQSTLWGICLLTDVVRLRGRERRASPDAVKGSARGCRGTYL